MNKSLYAILFIVITLLKTQNRVSQDPYIFGDSFRNICRFILDDESNFDPTQVKHGDLIFVQLNYLEQFFAHYHPHITEKYILISHNHDLPAPKKFKQFLEDKKLFAWFTQNADYIHPKVFPIPIGLLNLFHGFSLGHLQLLEKARTHYPYTKNILCYANFTIETNKVERGHLAHLFTNTSWICWDKKINYSSFINRVTHAKFVLSPHGAGLDCHRTWEILYLGSYPIVKSSTLDQLYDQLPVFIVNKWEELTQELLEKKYAEMATKKYSYEKLTYDYWHNLIRKVQDECRH